MSEHPYRLPHRRVPVPSTISPFLLSPPQYTITPVPRKPIAALHLAGGIFGIAYAILSFRRRAHSALSEKIKFSF